MPARWSHVPAGGGVEFDWESDRVHVKCSVGTSDGAVTVVEDLLKPGFSLARHHHKKMIEVFYVLDGAVDFILDDAVVTIGPGDTLSIPPGVPHAVSCAGGGRMLTVFAPGGFDQYLADSVTLAQVDSASEAEMRELGERFDIWPDEDTSSN